MNTIRKERLQSLARSLEVACEKIDEGCDTTAVLKCFAICISDLVAIASPAEPAEPTPAESLTRRDYLAAHAPAEPQPWFDVQLLDHPGNPMHQPHHGDFGLAWDDACDDVSGPTAKVNEYLDACTSWGHANVGWYADKEQARLVQWPYAWADAVLATGGEAK